MSIEIELWIEYLNIIRTTVENNAAVKIHLFSFNRKKKSQTMKIYEPGL